MKETVYNLPGAFFGHKPAAVHIYFYEAGQSSRNNRVTFGHNLICFMQAGEKEIAAPGLHERFGHNDLYLLGKGNVLMSEKTTVDNRYRSILLFFSNAYLLDFLQRNNIALSRAHTSAHCIRAEKDGYLRHFEQSLELLGDQLIQNTHLLRAKIDELLLYLLEREPGQTLALFRGIVDDGRNASLTEAVRANLDTNLTVEELAFLCSMSASTFKRRFAEVYHTTPKQYFIDHRMQKATALLREGKRPGEIFFELGYEDLPAFSREFKKHFGVSPREFAVNV